MPSLVIRLPAITTEMDTGKLLRWMINVGDHIQEGDPICEFTTDKVDTELESPYTGVVKQLLVPEGGSVTVGDGIAVVDGQAPDLLGDLDRYDESTMGNHVQEAGSVLAEAVQAEAEHVHGPREIPAPRAVRLEAKRLGIDLAHISPTGSRGQVTMDDVLAYHAQHHTNPEQSTASEQHADTAERTDSAKTAQGAEPIKVDTPPRFDQGSGEEEALITRQDDGGADRHESPDSATYRPSERRGRRGERAAGHRRGRRQRQAQAEPMMDTPAPAPVEQVIEAPTPARVVVPTPEPIIQQIRVEVPLEPPCTLFANVDVTELLDGQPNGLALLSRVVWAYGQALWIHPEANAIWDTQAQAPAPIDTVFIDVGMETPESTMETVPIAVHIDATIAQVALAVSNGYGLVRQGVSPELIAPQRSASLVDLGPWQIERVTPVIQPPQVSALSIGEVQTTPSLLGRTLTIRQTLTLGLAIDARVLDPVQAATVMATIVDQLLTGDSQ